MSSSNRTGGLRLLPVIKGYYLVLGGGKIGTNFTEHARNHRLPLVLVVDNNKNAPASFGIELIKDANALRKILEGKLRLPLKKVATTCNCHGVVNLFRICPQWRENNFD